MRDSNTRLAKKDHMQIDIRPTAQDLQSGRKWIMYRSDIGGQGGAYESSEGNTEVE
jgi:hypothetical protein